ncbi:hypothetical protein ciss_10650, partial [Carboxydothermus islandicus]
MKEDLKPYAYKQSEPLEGGDGVLFVERAGELLYVARLRLIRPEPKRKRVRRGRK